MPSCVLPYIFKARVLPLFFRSRACLRFAGLRISTRKVNHAANARCRDLPLPLPLP